MNQIRAYRLGIVLLAVALTPSASSLLHADDAGTGADAGNTRATATPLAYGSYRGALGVEDADWFTFPGGAALSGPYCVEAEASGPVAANLTLRVEASFATQEAKRRVPVVDGVSRIGIALPPYKPTLAGLEPDGAVGALGGPWSLRVEALDSDDFGPGDAGTGEDAPATIVNAPFISRPCIAGRLGNGDVRDVLAFEADAGDQILLSYLAVGIGSTPTLHVLDPTGLSHLTVSNSSLASFEVPTSGVWYLAPTTTANGAAAWWAIGFTDDTGGQGCRPMCIE